MERSRVRQYAVVIVYAIALPWLASHALFYLWPTRDPEWHMLINGVIVMAGFGLAVRNYWN